MLKVCTLCNTESTFGTIHAPSCPKRKGTPVVRNTYSCPACGAYQKSPTADKCYRDQCQSSFVPPSPLTAAEIAYEKAI